MKKKQWSYPKYAIMKRVMQFFEDKGIELGNATITVKAGPIRKYEGEDEKGEGKYKLHRRTGEACVTVAFDANNEWGENLRQIKRAVGPMEKAGAPPYLSITK
jgi:hypothetical protein